MHLFTRKFTKRRNRASKEFLPRLNPPCDDNPIPSGCRQGRGGRGSEGGEEKSSARDDSSSVGRADRDSGSRASREGIASASRDLRDGRSSSSRETRSRSLVNPAHESSAGIWLGEGRRGRG